MKKDKKNAAGTVFVVLCMAACLLPFCGMALRPTTETTENRTLSSFPGLLTEEGGFNRQFFSEFETWFHEHFAFRNELVYADARIQGSLFGVSAEDSVIRGTDGWLYYASTLPDYQGTDRLTEREWTALEHDLALTARFARERGIRLVLAVPPNKNTLYGDHMPYYDSLVADGSHSVDRLPEIAEEAGIAYADLTACLRESGETLYLKRDSHWDNKGALLAYNCILDTLGCEHARYDDVVPVRTRTEDGDLNRMLYSFYGEKELNYRYDLPDVWQMTNGADSVEDPWIETSGPGSGFLLMFRDSFGNTLLPLVAPQFAEARFTKENPYRLEKLAEEYDPDFVILEKAERNLRDLLRTPPVISAPEADLPAKEERLATASDVRMVSAPVDINYYEITGSVDPSCVRTGTQIAVRVNGTAYDAFYTGETSFAVYLKKENVSLPAELEVLTADGDAAAVVLEKTVEEGELK